MKPLFQNSTDISFASIAWVDGVTGQQSRATDYSGHIREIYDAVFGDGLLVHFRRLGRATQAAGCVS